MTDAPSRGTDTALTVEHLRKVFRDRDGKEHEVLGDVSFEVARGSCLAIVGESGSGKTTIARIIAGLETATSGSVTVQPPASAPRRGGGVQMVFQDPYGSLNPRQRIGAGLDEMLVLAGVRSRVQRRRRVPELLAAVGLEERFADIRPSTLSGGQRQRVAIARALALDPAILILDEAVSALDVSVQAQVLDLLARIRAESEITYIFVTHDLGVVRQVSDDCLVLAHGEIVEHRPTIDLIENPAHDYTAQLLASVPRPGWVPVRRANR